MAAEQPKDLQKELEIQISELENRIDRLRATYEQYFLGFEKMEPTVQRKDVDRRFANLRKVQIRNTAQRFRFGVVTQKYNTYAMYWVRICRQIEEGTYKRHLQKAKRLVEEPVAAAPRRNVKEGEDSIDVELGDFEAVDMDAIIAEANASAEKYSRGATDTVPPELEAAVVRAPPKMVPLAAPMGHAKPPPTAATPAHPMRPAELPAGAKPRLLVRRVDPTRPQTPPNPPPAPKPEPPSPPPPPVARPATPANPMRPVTPANPMRPMAPPAGRPNPAPAIRPKPAGLPAAPPIARPPTVGAPITPVSPLGAPVVRPRPPLPLPSGKKPT